MKKISRRKFITLLTQSAGAAVVFQLLEACGIKPAAVPGTPTNTPFQALASGVDNGISIANAPGSTNTPLPSDTPAPTAEAATDTPSPAPDFAYLAVARGGDDPEALTRAAVAAIGGIGRFVPQGANVIIKPNICTAKKTYEDAATTNPWVVGALVKMCLEAGAGQVRVFDCPFSPSMDHFQEAYKNSKIAEQVLAAGGEMVDINFNNYALVQPPGTTYFRSAYIYKDILNADVLIDVPIAKSHSTTGLTLAMKNLMGILLDRPAMHATHIDQQIAELANYIRPKLTIIDGVRILVNGGPISDSRDDVRKMDTVIASADIVAADAFATTKLFALVDPSKWSTIDRVGYIKIGAKLGLGRSDLENLKITEINVG
jgi:uncharacterized protein (DUF362 family)